MSSEKKEREKWKKWKSAQCGYAHKSLPHVFEKKIEHAYILKGFATFWEFYRQKKVGDYEYHSFFVNFFPYLIFHI